MRLQEAGYTTGLRRQVPQRVRVVAGSRAAAGRAGLDDLQHRLRLGLRRLGLRQHRRSSTSGCSLVQHPAPPASASDARQGQGVRRYGDRRPGDGLPPRRRGLRRAVLPRGRALRPAQPRQPRGPLPRRPAVPADVPRPRGQAQLRARGVRQADGGRPARLRRPPQGQPAAAGRRHARARAWNTVRTLPAAARRARPARPRPDGAVGRPARQRRSSGPSVRTPTSCSPPTTASTSASSAWAAARGRRTTPTSGCRCSSPDRAWCRARAGRSPATSTSRRPSRSSPGSCPRAYRSGLSLVPTLSEPAPGAAAHAFLEHTQQTLTGGDPDAAFSGAELDRIPSFTAVRSRTALLARFDLDPRPRKVTGATSSTPTSGDRFERRNTFASPRRQPEVADLMARLAAFDACTETGDQPVPDGLPRACGSSPRGHYRRCVTPDVIVVDHHDSYTWNLVHLVARVTGVLPRVVQHDEVDADDVLRHSHVVLSPGPGHPSVARGLRGGHRGAARRHPPRARRVPGHAGTGDGVRRHGDAAVAGARRGRGDPPRRSGRLRGPAAGVRRRALPLARRGRAARRAWSRPRGARTAW